MIEVNSVLTAFVSGLIGLVASAIGTYLGVHWKIKKDLLAKYDESLRALRLEAYCKLWGLTRTLRTRMTHDVGTRRPFSMQPKGHLPDDWQPFGADERWTGEPEGCTGEAVEQAIFKDWSAPNF
jgi:hypothetical protein